jgi:hypothetical protein
MDATAYDVMMTMFGSACMTGVGTALYILDQYQSIDTFLINPIYCNEIAPAWSRAPAQTSQIDIRGRWLCTNDRMAMPDLKAGYWYGVLCLSLIRSRRSRARKTGGCVCGVGGSTMTG